MTNRDKLSTSVGKAPLSLISICLDADSLELLKRFAEMVPLFQFQLELDEYHADVRSSVSEWIGDPAPDVCLIDFDRDSRKAALTAERVHLSAPETALFAVSSRSNSDQIIQSMRSGCSEYLFKPLVKDQVLEAVERVGGRKRERMEQYNAPISVFIGSKGGCGVTTLVTQLGAILAGSNNRKTLVVDFHPNFGDGALYLGLTEHRYHIFELMESTDRLDAELLESLVIHHSSGLDFVPGPEDIEPARHILSEAVPETFNFLRQRYEQILVDLPAGLNEQSLAFIPYADYIYLVTVAEVAALRNVARLADYMMQRDIPKERIRVVVNRHDKRSLIPDAQIERVTRQKIYWTVPNQYNQVVRTISGGDPISQLTRSDILRRLREWAETIGGPTLTATETPKKENRGLLGLFGTSGDR